MDTIIKSAEKNLKLSALLSFVGINLRFISVNIIKPLILFDIIKPENHEHYYELHVPNMPDMCGDIVAVVVLFFAYFFITSASVKKSINGKSENSYEISGQYPESIRNLVHWSRGIFSVTIIGFSLYFLSKYFLSTGLEAFAEEAEESTLSSALVYLNYVIKEFSALVFVYAYCKYLSPNKSVKILLYTFFCVRNLFATNLLGLITQYDLYPCAPLLDVLSPIIIIYSIIGIII
ncbi:MAG: hypothetical protein Q6358_08565 [Candidatus Brocadiales bacterium]|nr:hypothetical protein [Candidatus Brocadiales bacterium]